jgi:hypothetical protein
METTTVNLLHVLNKEGMIRIKKDKSTARSEKIIKDFFDIEKEGEIKSYVSKDEIIVIKNNHKIKTFLV